MADATEKVAQFIAGMTYGQFAEDSKTIFAVVRALEVIGEAAKPTLRLKIRKKLLLRGEKLSIIWWKIVRKSGIDALDSRF